MKKTLHYLLLPIISLIFASSAFAQELVYEQDHGVSFNKGTIDSDALIAIIQKKQEELNKFVLGRIVTKSWSAKEDGDSSRLDNFTTKYLIYETLNELTVTADKSRFGKNTLELVKEASIIFGIAVAVNQKFDGNPSFFKQGAASDLMRFQEDSLQDDIAFNQTLDMVLNVCIENPELNVYFPIYGKLANAEDANRIWYENDSRYFQQKDALTTAYESVKSTVTSMLSLVAELKATKEGIENLKNGTIDSVLTISTQLWYELKKGETIDTALVDLLTAKVIEIKNIVPEAFLKRIPGLESINLKIDSLLEDTTVNRKISYLNEIILVVKKLQTDYESIRNGDFTPLLSVVSGAISTKLIANERGSYFLKMKNDMALIQEQPGLGAGVKRDLKQLLTNVEKLRFDQDFVDGVEHLQTYYTDWKQRQRTGVFNAARVDTLLSALKIRGDSIHAPSKPYEKFKSELVKQLKSELKQNRGVTKIYIVGLMDELGKDSLWNTVLHKKHFVPYFSQRQPLADRILVQLTQLSERSKMISELLLILANAHKPEGIHGFTFNETQVESSKELMNRLIDYMDKSGRFNASSVYLRSIVDNITYKEADSVKQQPASISLNFESVLFSLNDKLVKPSQMYRTRYFQPYINIGVNYSAFLNPNSLQVNDDGTTSRMNSLAFASEKIGVKFKIWNYQYTRSFQPGVSFKYYNAKGTSRSWNRPQPKPILDDFFVDVHTGGLLYNVVNLKTEKNFDFPFVGIGLGCRTFNGITFSGSLNQPYTNNAFKTENLFFMFSIDIPIIEYITAIRSK